MRCVNAKQEIGRLGTRYFLETLAEKLADLIKDKCLMRPCPMSSSEHSYVPPLSRNVLAKRRTPMPLRRPPCRGHRPSRSRKLATGNTLWSPSQVILTCARQEDCLLNGRDMWDRRLLLSSTKWYKLYDNHVSSMVPFLPEFWHNFSIFQIFWSKSPECSSGGWPEPGIGTSPELTSQHVLCYAYVGHHFLHHIMHSLYK